MRRITLLVALLLLGTTLAAATPTLTSVDVLTLNNDRTTPLGDEDTAIVVPYTLLGSAAQGLANADSFRISAITLESTLEIQVGGVSTPGNAWATAVLPCIVTAADNLRWTPPLNANGDRAAWTMRARDIGTNTTSASDVGVTVKVTPVRDSIGITVTSTPIPIVAGVATDFTFEDLRSHTDFADPDGDATIYMNLSFTGTPDTGWTAQRVNAAGQVVDTATGAATTLWHLARNEIFRLTITDPATGTIGIGRTQFQDSFGDSSYSFSWNYTVSPPPSGNTSNSDDGGGVLGGCGAGAAGMSLIVALSALTLRRRRHA